MSSRRSTGGYFDGMLTPIRSATSATNGLCWSGTRACQPRIYLSNEAFSSCGPRLIYRKACQEDGVFSNKGSSLMATKPFTCDGELNIIKSCTTTAIGPALAHNRTQNAKASKFSGAVLCHLEVITKPNDTFPVTMTHTDTRRKYELVFTFAHANQTS